MRGESISPFLSCVLTFEPSVHFSNDLLLESFIIIIAFKNIGNCLGVCIRQTLAFYSDRDTHSFSNSGFHGFSHSMVQFLHSGRIQEPLPELFLRLCRIKFCDFSESL